MSRSECDLLSVFLLRPPGRTPGIDTNYQFESQLTSMTRSWAALGIPELTETLKKGVEPRLAAAVSDTMCGSDATFFRDRQAFAELKTIVLPSLLQSRPATERLTIWLPACATGQTAYSVAIMLAEHFPAFRMRDVQILASDHDAEALARAQSGVYSQFEVQRGLPIQMLLRYFDQRPGRDEWQIKPQLREKITWMRLTRLESLTQLANPDLIFCSSRLDENDPALKQEIVSRMARRLVPSGFLVLGMSESNGGICNTLERVRDCKAAIYRTAVRKSIRLTA